MTHESPYESARRIAEKHRLPEQEIGVIPPGTVILSHFHGRHVDGAPTALVQRSAEHDYAQVDDLNHKHAFGWHQYPLNSFTEIPNG
jgi:hypothetical protein